MTGPKTTLALHLKRLTCEYDPPHANRLYFVVFQALSLWPRRMRGTATARQTKLMQVNVNSALMTKQ